MSIPAYHDFKFFFWRTQEGNRLHSLMKTCVMYLNGYKFSSEKFVLWVFRSLYFKILDHGLAKYDTIKYSTVYFS